MFPNALCVYELLNVLIISVSIVMTTFYVGLNFEPMCQPEMAPSTILLFGRAISLFGSEPHLRLGTDTQRSFDHGSEPVPTVEEKNAWKLE